MTPAPFMPLSEELSRYQEIYRAPDGTLVRFALSYVEQVKAKIASGEDGYSIVDLYLLNPTLDWRDASYILWTVFALCCIRFAVSGLMTPAWKKRFSVFKFIAGKLGCVKRGKLCKFAENFWYALWHSTSLVWGASLLIEEAGTAEEPGWSRMMFEQPDGRWFWIATAAEHSQGSVGWPLLLPSAPMRFYYLTQIAFWTSCLLFLRFETRRSDFIVFIIHHVATIGLVAFSYASSYWRVGLVILVLHDWVDVLLYWSKCLQYSYIRPVVTDCSFVLFVISYLVARLLLFPFYCVWPTIDSSYTSRITNGRIENHYSYPGGVLLPIFLSVLVALHVYWFGLIIRMVAKVLNDRRQGATEMSGDIRSDEESDSAESSSEEKRKGE
ncbi:longevity-assurance protein (LAG1) domain-containing protein [Besnoitia besnoiti]|uniref:Longevity-assurance protein (LAG1) domain-containing protein n=1 Tax=Besnoitia besnoiti TaxID=94643 RepID=A0A2A9M6K1_BESBE|nr:longevity-assurance protein (LAG1) domain-containing protein [Besnoitia besnoiti]PFH33615.1 longevity-assurance protein (LAG1) domain-containing protein [Besnoitia besnoiti]